MTSSAAHKSGCSLESWLKLRALEGIGDQTLLALVGEWKSPEAVLSASADELIHRGCSARLAGMITRGPDAAASRRIDQELRVIHERGIDVRTVLDATYPSRLKMIPELNGEAVPFEDFLESYFHNTAFLIAPERLNAMSAEEKARAGFTDPCLFGVVNKFIPSEEEMALRILPGNPYRPST